MGYIKSDERVPQNAVGLRLCKVNSRDELILCEAMMLGSRDAAIGTLNRAGVSGRVEVGGELKDHWADILDASGIWNETVSLDADSYRALKRRWLRCKVDKEEAAQ